MVPNYAGGSLGFLLQGTFSHTPGGLVGASHRAVASKKDPRSDVVMNAVEKWFEDHPARTELVVKTYGELRDLLELSQYRSGELRIVVEGLGLTNALVRRTNAKGEMVFSLPSAVDPAVRAVLLQKLASSPGCEIRVRGMAQLRNSLHLTGVSEDQLRVTVESMAGKGEIGCIEGNSGLRVWLISA